MTRINIKSENNLLTKLRQYETSIKDIRRNADFQILRKAARFALRQSSGDNIIQRRIDELRENLKRKFIDRTIEGFSNSYPYYGNDFALTILEKTGENMAPDFMSRFAYSSEPIARGLYNMAIAYADKRKKIREQLGHAAFTAVINPTNSCNRNCKECYIASGEVGKNPLYPRRDMNPDEMSLIISQMKGFYGTNFITWSGGEPTLKWKDIVKVLEKHPDIYGVMFTNSDFIGNNDKKRGKNKGEIILDEFARLGNVSIGNSLEGSPEYTDEIRGEGAFDNATRALKWEKQRDMFFGPSLTPTNDNINYIVSDEFMNFVSDELGAGFAYYFACMPLGPDPEGTKPYLLTPENRLKLVEGKSRRILKGDSLMHLDFWNDGALVQGCMAGGQNYLNFSPPHMPLEKIEEHVKKFGYKEEDVSTGILPCVFLQGIGGFLMKDGRVISNKEIYYSIPEFIENDNSMKGVREGFQQEIRDRMANGEHWLGSAPCMFYDHPEKGLMSFKDNFIDMQPTFTAHSGLKEYLKSFSEEWKTYIRREYPKMVERLNQEFELGLEGYVEWQKEIGDRLERGEKIKT